MRLQPLLVSALFSTLPISGYAAEIKCPDSITETPHVSSVAKSWKVVSIPGVRSLEQAGIYFGNPVELGAQVPDSTKEVKAKETSTWRLIRSKGDEFWIGCSYTGTTAMYFQKVSGNITECAVSYDLLPTGRRQRLSAIDCR